MKLNCKPGDLAVIIKGGLSDRNVGKLVTVIGPTDKIGEWMVRCDRPMNVAIGGIAAGEKFVGPIADSRLRPIRPQDDDAQDETLIWLGVPQFDSVGAAALAKTAAAMPALMTAVFGRRPLQ
jgi:hypothetical protein